MEYGRLPTIRVQDPDKPGEWLEINQSDWGDGKTYHPDLFPIFEAAPAPPAPPAKASGTKKG